MDDQVEYQQAVLLATFDKIARLDEDLLIWRNIFNCQLIDAFSFVDDNFLLFYRLLQGQEGLALDPVFTMNQKNCEILMSVGAGKLQVSDHRLLFLVSHERLAIL